MTSGRSRFCGTANPHLPTRRDCRLAAATGIGFVISYQLFAGTKRTASGKAKVVMVIALISHDGHLQSYRVPSSSSAVNYREMMRDRIG
jgi:hypothetical protein